LFGKVQSYKPADANDYYCVKVFRTFEIIIIDMNSLVFRFFTADI